MQAPPVATSTTSESLYESHMNALRAAHARQAASAASSALSRGHAYATPQRGSGPSSTGRSGATGASATVTSGGGIQKAATRTASGPRPVTAAAPALPPSFLAQGNTAGARGETGSRPASGPPSPQMVQRSERTSSHDDDMDDAQQGGFYSPLSTPRAVSGDGAVSPMSIPEGEEGNLLSGVPFSFSPRASADVVNSRPVTLGSVGRPGGGGGGGGGGGYAPRGRGPVRADHTVPRAGAVVPPVLPGQQQQQQQQQQSGPRSVSRGRSVSSRTSLQGPPRSRGTSVTSRGGPSGGNTSGAVDESAAAAVPARAVTVAQAEAFYARQTGWLRAKQEHDDRERDRRLKSLAAPGAGGKRRGGSAKPKLVSTADAEAFFASEVACKQRREEAMEKLREEARLKAAAREAAELAECTFAPNAAKRAAASAVAQSSQRDQAHQVHSVPYTPSARVLHLLTTRDRGLHSRVDPGPDVRNSSRFSICGGGGGSRPGTPGAGPPSTLRPRGSSTGRFNRIGSAVDVSAVRRDFGREAPPSPISTSGTPRAGSTSPAPASDQPAFDVDACLVDFERCLEAVLASTSPVRRSSPGQRDKRHSASRTPHRR